MDDFLYSEPAVVPEPTTLLLLGTTMAGLGLTARWRRRRQK
jgi:PEP-CTERM motif